MAKTLNEYYEDKRLQNAIIHIANADNLIEESANLALLVEVMGDNVKHLALLISTIEKMIAPHADKMPSLSAALTKVRAALAKVGAGGFIQALKNKTGISSDVFKIIAFASGMANGVSQLDTILHTFFSDDDIQKLSTNEGKKRKLKEDAVGNAEDINGQAKKKVRVNDPNQKQKIRVGDPNNQNRGAHPNPNQNQPAQPAQQKQTSPDDPFADLNSPAKQNQEQQPQNAPQEKTNAPQEPAAKNNVLTGIEKKFGKGGIKKFVGMVKNAFQPSPDILKMVGLGDNASKVANVQSFFKSMPFVDPNKIAAELANLSPTDAFAVAKSGQAVKSQISGLVGAATGNKQSQPNNAAQPTTNAPKTNNATPINQSAAPQSQTAPPPATTDQQTAPAAPQAAQNTPQTANPQDSTSNHVSVFQKLLADKTGKQVSPETAKTFLDLAQQALKAQASQPQAPVQKKA